MNIAFSFDKRRDRGREQRNCISEVMEMEARGDGYIDHVVHVAFSIIDGKFGVVKGIIRDKDLVKIRGEKMSFFFFFLNPFIVR